ncbi:MAG: hypothetical protein QM634_14695, partial [Gordonia sp. (in: high G+C Gram-positive bacteria)]
PLPGGAPGYPPSGPPRPSPPPEDGWTPNPAAGHGRHEAPDFATVGFTPGAPATERINPADPLARSSVPTAATPNRLTIASPPNGLLLAAAVTAVLGGLIGAVGWARWWSLIGWVLAGPIAIWLVARFVAVDTARKTETVYSRPGTTGVFWVVAIVAVVVAIAVTALSVGFWIGRL